MERFMNRTMSFPTRVGIGCALIFFILFAASASGQRVRDDAEPIYLSFTPSGEWLIASYYRTAMNRPGTDWGAWTVEWNKKTWEATKLEDATMPIAASRDGKWLAMAHYDRRIRRLGPHSKLALWKPG